MQSNDERLRLAYNAALETRAQTASHPEPEALVAVAERSGSEAVRLEILDHVMMCSACRRDLDLIRAGLAAAGMPRRRTWFRSPSIGLMALAATLLLVAGVRLFTARGDLESGPRLRGTSAVSTYPARWLSSGDARLAWRPVADAAHYRLELIDDAGSAVVDSTMRDTSLVVSESLLRNRRGLSWSVTATLGDGSSLPSEPVRLVPPAREWWLAGRVVSVRAVSRRLRAPERNVDWRSFILPHGLDRGWVLAPSSSQEVLCAWAC